MRQDAFCRVFNLWTSMNLMRRIGRDTGNVTRAVPGVCTLASIGYCSPDRHALPRKIYTCKIHYLKVDVSTVHVLRLPANWPIIVIPQASVNQIQPLSVSGTRG